jgi:hypothetical protein
MQRISVFVEAVPARGYVGYLHQSKPVRYISSWRAKVPDNFRLGLRLRPGLRLRHRLNGLKWQSDCDRECDHMTIGVKLKGIPRSPLWLQLAAVTTAVNTIHCMYVFQERSSWAACICMHCYLAKCEFVASFDHGVASRGHLQWPILNSFCLLMYE